MAMTTIQVQAAHSATSNISRTIREQMGIINGYNRFITQLQGNWSGEGYNKFVMTFERLSPKMRQKFESMNEYNNEIIQLLQEMQDIDNSSAALFDNV